MTPFPTPNLLRLHRAWIGLLQPDGIVVSAAALADAGLAPVPVTDALREALAGCALVADPSARFVRVATEILGWDRAWIVDDAATLTRYTRHLAEFAHDLAPTYVVANPNVGSAHEKRPVLALVKVFPRGWDLDRAHGGEGEAKWRASPLAQTERLLRENDVPLGLLTNGEVIRVVYAPAGEGTGAMTFPLALLATSDGAPALAALGMLLGRDRLWDESPDGAKPEARDKRFLPHLLAESRRYQNNVSTALAEQVLDALWVLLRGFQDAHTASGETLLRDWLGTDPQALYGGLLTVLLRLIFLLYAEDRDQLPGDDTYTLNYGVRALFERLRDDAARHPDTMSLRFGAWPRLVATFRLIHDGGGHGAVHLPSREGGLFHPDRYPFLEGRPRGDTRQADAVLDLPAISDGVVLTVLKRLLRVEQEDLSYKTLGVEELGSVYESMMGFTVLTTTGRSLALKPNDVVVDLDALLKVAGKGREKSLDELAGVKLTGKAKDAVAAATTVDALAEALAGRRSARTPEVIATGAMVLQPTAERRRSGSHYTPRALTEPIVKRTLDPVLEALGPAPTHAQLLALKVCDPAMGSGAFLVAACRYLGDLLHAAWLRDEGAGRPAEVARISPDDNERVVARRLIAQHCLYGVDKNPFAVDLARLSLWLETLAKEHPFTFLDHALREGNSLVGVTAQQIRWIAFEEPKKQLMFVDPVVRRGVATAIEKRAAIRALALSDDTQEKRRLLEESESAVGLARALGNALVAGFFAETKESARKKRLTALRDSFAMLADERALRQAAEAARAGLTLRPFHWEIEFPEVFAQENPGFDVVVGNPPFMGGTRLSSVLGEGFRDWLASVHEGGSSNADLAAHFFRRAFSLLREGGAFGLVSTNSIYQGDSRELGLTWLRQHSGFIFEAQRRVPWPGLAAVVVSVVHVTRGRRPTACRLDGVTVDSISSFLFPGDTDATPPSLKANDDIVSRGNDVFGAGFVLEPPITSEAQLSSLLNNPHNHSRIRPYLTGEDLNSSPTQEPSRSIIDFESMPEAEARQWPDLFQIVETHVKPAREKVTQKDRRDLWWIYATRAPLYRSHIRQHDEFIALSMVTQHIGFAIVTGKPVISNTLVAFCEYNRGFFAVLQSRTHEVWARFFASSLEERLRYTPSDCFETFPFPRGWETDAALEDIGKRYHDRRAEIMKARWEGLTKTYNRFHDPQCTDDDIEALRALHAEMDRAVLAAYGWTDLDLATDFHPEHADEPDGKKRLRWSDGTRDAVLGRLLALNAERAAEERAAEERAATGKDTTRKGRRGSA